jgi:carbonic anhydrase/acetyltransferase-like protein (isoleucine patch superfamily)
MTATALAITTKTTSSTATVMTLRGATPRIDANAYVAPATTLIGDIEIGPQSTVWPAAVLRADSGSIRVGARANIQDGTVVHVNYKGRGVEIGDDVTIGHMALIHACTLEAGCFIGMKACVMDDAVVEAGAMLAAGSLLTKGKRIPAGQLWSGTPAKFVRELTDEEKTNMAIPAAHYAELGQAYLAEQQGRTGMPTQTAASREAAPAQSATILPLRLASAAHAPAEAAPRIAARVGHAAHASRTAANGRRARTPAHRRIGRGNGARVRAAG